MATIDEYYTKRQYVKQTSASRSFVYIGPVTDNEASVILALNQTFGIYRGSVHPLDGYISVPPDGLNVAQRSNNCWDITVAYKKGTFTDDDPLHQPPIYQWLPTNSSEPTSTDDGGDLLLNSAGDPPATPPNRPHFEIDFTIQRNEAFFPAAYLPIYANAVNSSPFRLGPFSIQPGQALMKPFTQTQAVKSTALYVTVQYAIKVRPAETPFTKDSSGLWNCFAIRFPDKGRRAWWLDANKNVVFLPICEVTPDGKSRPVTQDVLLDGTGQVLDTFNFTAGPTGNVYAPNPNPNIPPNFDASTPPGGYGTILSFANIKTANFNALNIFY